MLKKQNKETVPFEECLSGMIPFGTRSWFAGKDFSDTFPETAPLQNMYAAKENKGIPCVQRRECPCSFLHRLYANFMAPFSHRFPQASIRCSPR